MYLPKTSKNSDFLSSLIRKKQQSFDISNQKQNININNNNINDLHLRETELMIDNKVFNNDIVLYAKSKTSKQK